MRLLVLGASGRTGRLVTRIAIERSHEVTALVRPGSESKVPEGARVVAGEASDPETLAQLLAEHSTVLCAIGLNRASLFPWARLLSPPNLVEQVATIVRDHSSNRNDFRFIWMSAGGVGPSAGLITFPISRMIGMGNVGVAYEDLRRAEKVFAGVSECSFPIRPVTLLPGDNGSTARRKHRYGLFSCVRRGGIARYMVDLAESRADSKDLPALIGA